MERKYFDITLPIGSDMVTWPGDGPVRVERVRSMADGDRLNQSRLDMSAHTGTHIDAPVHFLRDGTGVDSLPLEILMGPAVVVSVKGPAIGPAQLEGANMPPGTDRLLLKTDNGSYLERARFHKEYSHLTLEGARYLVENGVRLVGIDYLSIAKYGSGDEVHRALLSEGIVIVEGVDLREVPPGKYKMAALPLKIRDCDGAPARVILETIVGG